MGLLRVGQPTLGVDGSGAALSRSGDGLAIDMIGDIAGRKNSLNTGVGALFLDEVAVFIYWQGMAKRSGIRLVADETNTHFKANSETDPSLRFLSVTPRTSPASSVR